MTVVSINGYELNEIKMLLEPYSKNTVSYLKYPEHRIEANVKGDILSLKLPAFLCVELYRRAILPQNPSDRISICLDGFDIGQYVIRDFRYPHSIERESVSLTLQKVSDVHA